MKGNQIPRIRIEPDWTETDGTGAAMLMQAYGVTLDEWQRLVIDAWLCKDSAGNYAVTSAGLSVSRQNGKNVCIECREFYGLVINGERILHTAHQMRTCKKAFRRLVNMFTDKRHPEIMEAVKQIRYGIGEESIELNNGGIIEFTARSRQAARGYDGISLVVFDESQELLDEQLESILSTLASSVTGTRQIIYTGTAPYMGCSAEVFRRFRDACIASAGRGEKGHFCWHEWGVAAEKITDIDITDKKLWYECNPALGYRLTEEFTEEEAKTLSADGFARERLNFWQKIAEAVTETAISAEAWDACISNEPHPTGKTAYGVKFTPDGSEVVLAGCVMPRQGKTRIELIAVEPTGNGLQWLADWLNQRYSQTSCVVIDGRNGSDVLIDKLKDTWRIKNSIIKPSAQNVVTAAQMLINDLHEKSITWYAGQPELRESAITATKRQISGGFGFGGSTCAPVEACSLALWGVKSSRRDPTRQMRIG